MTTCLVTGYDAAYARIGDLTTPGKRAYAARHGLAFRCYRDIPPGEAPAFYKMRAVRAALAEYESVVYLDADTLVTDPSRPPPGGVPGLNVSADWSAGRADGLGPEFHFSLGNFRATRESVPLWDAAVARAEWATAWDYDQGAVRAAMTSDPALAALVHVYPRRVWNPVDGVLRPGAVDPWRAGDWVCHLTADPVSRVVPRLARMGVAPNGCHLSHHGSRGDIVYHLAPFRQTGGGHLHLFGMPADVTRRVIPLLEAQPYVRGVVDRGPDAGPAPNSLCSLTWLHRHLDARLNLSDMVSAWLGMPHWPRDVPWLEGVEPDPVAPVVVNRTPRYPSPGFPWGRVAEAYRGRAVFVGLPDEHAAFCREAGDIPYHPADDMLALARVIAGCEVFVGNSSAALAVAEGLKKVAVCAADPALGNHTHWDRPGYRHVADGNVTLPPLGGSAG